MNGSIARNFRFMNESQIISKGMKIGPFCRIQTMIYNARKVFELIVPYIIITQFYHGSHFSVRNRKLSTFFNDVCIDVVHFLLPVLSIKSMSIFWSLTYIFQKCYLCFMNTPYLSFIRQQLCKHGICSNLSKNIKIILSIT